MPRPDLPTQALHHRIAGHSSGLQWGVQPPVCTQSTGGLHLCVHGTTALSDQHTLDLVLLLLSPGRPPLLPTGL